MAGDLDPFLVEPTAHNPPAAAARACAPHPNSTAVHPRAVTPIGDASQRGETFASAPAAVGCSTKPIQRLLARTGGLERRAQERSPLRLSPADREELSRGLMAGDSLRQIAGRLRRVVSTLCEDEYSERSRRLS